MNNNMYKDQDNRKIVKLLIIVLIVVFILFMISNLAQILTNNKEPGTVSYENLKTVKEVIEYYKSKYISEKESEEKNYKLDIYVVLSKMPYDENDNSNEEYYNNLLGDVARVIGYESYRMFDEENGVTIEVICKNKKIVSIIINGIEDYFIYMDSQISMKNYDEIQITNFEITSDVLRACIDNRWNTSINFGSRDSVFNEYNIYFDEGIKVRNIQNKIYNIVFTTKYQGTVINNVHPGMSTSDVIEIMGKPTFSDEELNVIGYKGQKVYVFFSDNEISVYRIPEEIENIKDFLEIVDIYLNEEDSDLLEFMNQLTYVWKDYSEYIYDSKSFFIAYPLRGIEIKVNYDNTNGILVYNNVRENLEDIGTYLKSTNFIARLQIDSVYEAEKRRYSKESKLLDKCDEFTSSLDEEELERIGESLLYKIYPELDSNNRIYSMKFISRNGENPNRELNDGINTYLWIYSDYFIYSKEGKGIFSYDLNTGRVTQLIDGKDAFNIVSYKDGVLKYDKEKVVIQ